MKQKTKNILYIILLSIFLWIAITSNIQRFMNTKLSETELFILIPRNFILDFEK